MFWRVEGEEKRRGRCYRISSGACRFHPRRYPTVAFFIVPRTRRLGSERVLRPLEIKSAIPRIRCPFSFHVNAIRLYVPDLPRRRDATLRGPPTTRRIIFKLPEVFFLREFLRVCSLPLCLDGEYL